MLVYQRVSILESTNDHKEIINLNFSATEISSCEAWMPGAGWGNELGETFWSLLTTESS